MSSICLNRAKTDQLKWVSLRQVLIVGFILVNWALPVRADESVSVIRRFSGNVSDPNLLMLSPRFNIITTQKQWKTLWLKWRPGQELYPVDLDKVLVLVETTPGPNRIFSNQLKRDSEGDLFYELAATEKAGPGFSFLIMVIEKSGINSINGKKFDGSPVKPAIQPVVPKNNSSPPKNAPEIQSERRESVRVDMTGRVRTQFKSVGTENLGTVISANGIIWELDLSDKPKLLEKLGESNDALVNVSGVLSMERQRGARTARLRYIVKVDNLDVIETSTATASSEMPSPLNSRPPTKQPLENPASVDSRKLTAPAKKEPKIPLPRRTMGFSEISLVTSDGQLQTILADGSIHYESKSRNLSRDWNANPEEMEILNQFIIKTDWEAVPKLTRADEGTADEINYSISIKNPQFVRRIFIDRSKISSQPQIKTLFTILGNMAKGN